MQVYIEYVIANNLLINALILVLTMRFMRYKINKLAILLSSALGTVFAVFLPIYGILNIFVFKLILSLIMLAIVMGKCGFKRYLCACAIFYALTFALGGATMGLASLFSYELADLSSSLIPFFVAVAGLALVAGQKLIYKHIVLARRKSRYEDTVVLSANGREITCKAYYDSGNRLYYKNKPTIIVDESIALQFYGQNGLNALDNYTQIDTVIGKKNIKVFPLDYIKEEGKKDKVYGVMAGISERAQGQYKVVLHCDL
ncbi:MAG: sigma-E processing peptidase SpoIIGA [Clostridia bacterium]|nr:sigma-E processing peptidase SpoIIGA [Clostridia bacterium]